MKKSMWGWFKRLFSNYSKKTMHLYRIFLFKIDIYLFNRKKNKYFKQIGKIFYNELLNGKETDQIIETLQPIFSNIEKIDSDIEELIKKINHIAEKEKISKEDVEKIDKFIIDADKKLKDSIFDDFDDFDLDNEIEEVKLKYNHNNDDSNLNDKIDNKTKKIKTKKSKKSKVKKNKKYNKNLNNEID